MVSFTSLSVHFTAMFFVIQRYTTVIKGLHSFLLSRFRCVFLSFVHRSFCADTHAHTQAFHSFARSSSTNYRSLPDPRHPFFFHCIIHSQPFLCVAFRWISSPFAFLLLYSLFLHCAPASSIYRSFALSIFGGWGRGLFLTPIRYCSRR